MATITTPSGLTANEVQVESILLDSELNLNIITSTSSFTKGFDFPTGYAAAVRTTNGKKHLQFFRAPRDDKDSWGAWRDMRLYTKATAFMEGNRGRSELLEQLFAAGAESVLLYGTQGGACDYVLNPDLVSAFSAPVPPSQRESKSAMGRTAFDPAAHDFEERVAQKLSWAQYLFDSILATVTQVRGDDADMAALDALRREKALKPEAAKIYQAVTSGTLDAEASAIIAQAFQGDMPETVVAITESSAPMEALAKLHRDGVVQGPELQKLAASYLASDYLVIDWSSDATQESVEAITARQNSASRPRRVSLLPTHEEQEAFPHIDTLTSQADYGGIGAESLTRVASGIDKLHTPFHSPEDFVKFNSVHRFDYSGAKGIAPYTILKEVRGLVPSAGKAAVVVPASMANDIFEAMGSTPSIAVADDTRPDVITIFLTSRNNGMPVSDAGAGVLNAHDIVSGEDGLYALYLQSRTTGAHGTRGALSKMIHDAVTVAEGFYYTVAPSRPNKRGIDLFLERARTFITSKIVERQDKEMLPKLVQGLAKEDIEDVFSAANVDRRDKIFPDVLRAKANQRLSIKDISEDPALIARFLAIPAIAPTIKTMLEQHGYGDKIPTVAPFVYNLMDPAANELALHEKDKVIDYGRNLGILNYKYLPPMIAINTEESKERFLDLAAEAVKIRAEDDAANVSEIRHRLADTIGPAVLNGNMVILKGDKRITGRSLIEDIPVFTIVDEFFNETSVLRIEPFSFYEAMRSQGMLHESERTMPVTMRPQDVHAIFDAISQFVNRYETSNKKLFAAARQSVDQLAGAIMDRFGTVPTPDVFSVKNDALAKYLIKAGKESSIAELARKVLKDPLGAKGIPGALKRQIPELTDEQIQGIEKFLATNFNGKEFEVMSGATRERFHDFFKTALGAYGFAGPLWELMSSAAEHEKIVRTAVIKVFQTAVYANYTDRLMQKHGDIPVETKNSMINAFMSSILGLREHQLLEAKGFVSLALSGEKSTELPFWEMRTGKTRTMLAVQFLMSAVRKGTSLMLVQNKNSDDIIMQAYDMYPMMVSEMGQFLGKQNRFHLENYSAPLPMATVVYPNIPIRLKRILRNPDPDSDDAPSVVLKREFVGRYEQILSRLTEVGDATKIKAMTAEVANTQPEFESLAKTCAAAFDELPDEMFRSCAASLYYLSHLLKSGYLPEESLGEAVANTVKFWKEITKEQKVYSSKKHGAIVFGGKELIGAFAAEEDALNDLKAKKAGFGSAVLADDPIRVASVRDNRVPISTHEYYNEYAPMFESLELPAGFDPLLKEGYAVTACVDAGEGVESLVHSWGLAAKRVEKILTGWVEESGYEMDPGMQKSFVNAVVQSAIGAKLVGDFRAVLAPATHKEAPYPCVFINKGTPVLVKALEMGRYVDEAHLKNMISSMQIEDPQHFLERAIRPKELKALVARELTHEEYKRAVVSLYLRADKGTTTIKARAAKAFPGIEKVSIDTLEIDISLDGGLEALPDSGNIKRGDEHANIAHAQFEYEINDPEHPDEFRTVSARPTEVSTIMEGSKITYHIKRAMYLDGDQQTEIEQGYKRTSMPAVASCLWRFDPAKKIDNIAVDEGHKNITSKQGSFAMSSLVGKVRSMYHGATVTVGTGTPLSSLDGFANMINTVMGTSDKAFARALYRYCGKYRFRSDFVAALFALMEKNPEVRREIFEDVVSTAKYGVEPEYIILDATKSFERVWKSEAVTAFLNSTESILGELSFSRYDAQSGYTELFTVLCQAVANEVKTQLETKTIKSRTEFSLGEGFIYEATIKGGKKLMTLAPGFTSPLILASLLDYFTGANLSIKRPSGQINYDILDLDHLDKMAVDNRVLYRDKAVKNPEAMALLQVEAAAREYRKALSVGQLKKDFLVMAKVLSRAIKANPGHFGLNIYEANAFLNRSLSSVEDSYVDYCVYRLNGNEDGGIFSAEKLTFFGALTPYFDALVLDGQGISSLARRAVLGSTTSSTLPLLKHDMVLADGREVTLDIHQETAAEAAFSYESKDSRPATFEDGGSYVVENGIPHYLEMDGTRHRVLFHVPLQYQVDPMFPPIAFGLNVANSDDRSVIEALAFSGETSNVMLEHINAGESIRVMTTRVAITEAAFDRTVLAAMNREDKTSPFYVVVNITQDSIEKHVDSFLKQSGQHLDDAAVRVVKTTPGGITAVFGDIRATGCNMAVVSNYASLAEGFAMDFIHTGIYMGALNSISSSIQSFARQLGPQSNTSKFYLANNGFGFGLRGRLKKTASNLADALEGGIFVDAANAKAVLSKFTPLLEIGEAIPSYNARANKQKEEYLAAYEHFMSGKEKPLSHHSAKKTNLEQVIAAACTVETYLEEKKPNRKGTLTAPPPAPAVKPS